MALPPLMVFVADMFAVNLDVASGEHQDEQAGPGDRFEHDMNVISNRSYTGHTQNYPLA
jgi:hypothetical protein